MQIQAQPQEYDAIVVGSGASGGWAAKRMSEAGLRVALVCAGRPLKDGDYREHVQPYELKYVMPKYGLRSPIAGGVGMRKTSLCERARNCAVLYGSMSRMCHGTFRH